MCGIAGIVPRGSKPDLPGRLAAMGHSLNQRGPDDEGYFLLGRGQQAGFYSGDKSPQDIRERFPRIEQAPAGDYALGLAHTRFSILDISSAGHQPWHEKQAGLVIVYNGEIFNYLELRRELEQKGQGPFVSSSDTEVLAKAYAYWGAAAFERFNGFWACAICDLNKRQLILSRDRYGQKPLYLHANSSAITFASDIRSLAQGLDGGLSSLSLNHGAAFLYLAFDRRNTVHGSFWNEIELMPQASFRVVELESLATTESRYYSLPAKRVSEKEIGFSEAVSKFKDLFWNAVGIRLRSDVPYAADLSGGMDSSSICAAAQNILGSNAKLNTSYTGYAHAPELDESGFARMVAQRAGTAHRELTISPEESWNHLDSLILDFEEPVHSQSYMTQWRSWKKSRELGIKVILHGAAADELMAGYDHLAMQAIVDQIHSGNLFSILRGDPSVVPYRILRAVKWLLNGRIFPGFSNALRALLGQVDRRRWMPDYSPAFLTGYFTESFRERSQDSLEKLNAVFLQANQNLSSRLLADFVSLRIPFWVNAMDKSMMSLPVEVRMPFLDFQLVDFMFSVPVSYHFKNGWTKYLLRRAMQGHLPEEVIWRPNKVGFSVPKRNWLTPRINEIRSAILGEREKMASMFNLEALLKFDNLDMNFLWRAFNFAKWLAIFQPKVS